MQKAYPYAMALLFWELTQPQISSFRPKKQPESAQIEPIITKKSTFLSRFLFFSPKKPFEKSYPLLLPHRFYAGGEDVFFFGCLILGGFLRYMILMCIFAFNDTNMIANEH